MQTPPSQPCRSAIPLPDPRFAYRSAAHTNVRETWARFGWAPPARPQERQ